jgi:peptide chain release factor subunit 1
MTPFKETLQSAVSSRADNVLTVYLNTNQENASNLNRAFETHLASQLKDVRQSVENVAESEEFDAASAHVQSFVRDYKPVDRSLLLFAASDGILLSRGLQVDLPTEARWGRPHIKPFLEAVDEFERYIVVVTNKWQARLLSVFLGKVEASVDVRDDPNTTHIQTTGTDHLESQTRFQRRADEHTKKHVKHLVQELEIMMQRYPSNRIILGGNVEALAELFRLLPKHLRGRVAGTVTLSMTDSIEQLAKSAMEVDLKVERDSEVGSVNRLEVAAGKKNKATMGPEDTLKALGEKRILSLYYAEGATISGKECASCNALFTADAGDACGYCGKPLEANKDLLDAILLNALESGAQIEQVRGVAADTLRLNGAIGAFLRY